MTEAMESLSSSDFWFCVDDCLGHNGDWLFWSRYVSVLHSRIRTESTQFFGPSLRFGSSPTFWKICQTFQLSFLVPVHPLDPIRREIKWTLTLLYYQLFIFSVYPEIFLFQTMLNRIHKKTLVYQFFFPLIGNKKVFSTIWWQRRKFIFTFCMVYDNNK